MVSVFRVEVSEPGLRFFGFGFMVRVSDENESVEIEELG